MNKHNIKRILICLVLLACLIGAASASDVSDISLDDSSVDAVAVDAISEDSGDTVYNTVSEVQANASQELNDDNNVVEQTKNSLSSSNVKDGEVSNIYVSTTGNDENDGSSAANAVATVAKAVEIVNATEGTDFTIFIANGDYNIERIESPEAKNVNLIGESKEGAILHASGLYGINVYQDDVNWTIENLTFCDLNSTGSSSRGITHYADNGVLKVNNCIFRNIGSKNGVIYVSATNGIAEISNVLIEDCFGTYSSTSSIIHLYGESQTTLDNVEIRGSYMDPSVGAATYLRSIIYADQQYPVVNLINSRIVDNNGSIGSLIEAKCKFNVANTTFENNYINYSANGVNGGTYMFYSGTSSSSASNINITQSVIKDNVIAGGSIGLFNIVYGTHNIDHSIIMNNKYANGNDVPIGSFSSSTITADNNYWGTNERPNTRTSQWVILTEDVPEYEFVGVADSIPVYLNTYNTTSGETGAVEGMPDVELGLSYALNTGNPSTVTISNGQGAIDYLATLDGDETVTFSTGDSFSFEVNADVSSLIYVDASAETSGTGTSESPFKTIAEALNIAADGKIIVIRSGTYEESDLVIDDDITLKADKGASVTIDADMEGRVFTVTSTAIIKDISLTGGMPTTDGGAILLDGGSLTLNNVNISDCYAVNGGAIATTAGSNLTVTNCAFSENMAMYGGAIYIAGEANITQSVFDANEAQDKGGAIYVNSSSPVSISSNTFNGNDANKGEAIYIETGDVDLSGNTMTANETIYLGGGSVATALVFMGGQTITAEFNQDLNISASLTDDNGNTIRGGTVTFTANGGTIGTVDLSVTSDLKLAYTTPSTADSDLTISGSYSNDNGGSVVNGTIHLAIPYWFIGTTGYETLADAVAAAQNGDVIIGKPGTYTVNGITINKDITIKANESGDIVLDGGKSRMFSLGTLVEATLENLILTNGGSSGGGFVYVSSTGTLNIINSTLKDLSASSAGGAISVTSGGKVNIEDSRFENINSTSGPAVLQATGPSSVITIKDSSFDRIKQTSNDHTFMQVSGNLTVERSNFTNIDGCNRSNYYCGISTYSSSANFTISECQFINMTGGDGSAIYFGSTGKLNVTKSVFMNIDSQRGAIFVNNPGSANINYNLFIDNTAVSTNAKDVYINSGSNINASYNFWGSNSQPTTKEISNVARAPYWTIVELSTAADPVYIGTTPDIAVQFVGTDGLENLTLEDTMPEYSFDLAVTAGSLSVDSVTLVDNEASVVFTPPASEGTVTVTATPGPAELVLNVVDPAVLLVVSTDGDDDTGAGTLDNPYATIEHALTQVTDTRNIIYILSKGEDYLESDLTVSGNVIIRGEDNTVTIDADSEGRVFIVTGTLTLEDISLTGGVTNDIGGAIFVNGGNLTVNNVIISDCGAGSGGAIGTTAGSNLTVDSSAFNGNMAMNGGAIYVGGEASISDSTFEDHEYSIYGGAIYVNTTDDVAITGNSFDGNDADKGEAIYIENGAVSLSENTMVDVETIFIKGGSVNGILIFLANTTVNADFGETVDLTATLTDDMGNPIVGGNVVFTANGETVATVENSGSSLQTTYTVPTDASGDILISGSFSLGDGMVVATGVLHPAISYWFIEGGSGYETLAQAIDAAQTGDVIYGLPGTYDISGLTVNKAVTIKANESGSIILNGKGNQILRTSANVILENLTFINGSATDNGGLIYISSNSLVINNSVLKDTQATGGQGAAIYVASGASNVVIENSAFDNINTTAAAVINCRSTSSVFTVVKSNFTNMDITTNGVFYFYEGGINAIESQFINITGGDGAAIYFYGLNNNNVTKCLFDNVTTTKTSGIIYSNSKSANVSYNVFLGINKGMYSSSSYSGVITADYNYWGTNDNPSDYVNSNTKLNNWVIMTVTPDAVDSIAPGATQAFTVDFTHYTDGTANYTMADTIPELTVSASATNGQLDVSEKETVNNQAVFTYTMGDYESDTVTFTNADVSIPVAIAGASEYSGIIYVAKDGEDTNDGSEESPVASIAKAVELAQGKSGQIIIKEGTYVAQVVNITDDLDISTQGNVIIDGNGVKAFFIKSGDVSISNMTFTNCLDQYSGSAIRVSGGSLFLDGCTFVDNGGEAARDSVINVKNANLVVDNCIFENNTAHPTSTSYSVIYTSDSTLIVNNTQFNTNKFKYGAIYMSGTIGIINNTLFQGFSSVSSSGGSGAGIYAGGTAAYQYSNGTVRPGAPSIVLVQNCEFINNTVNGGSLYSGQGGAIYVNNNATVMVEDSKFINNTARPNTDGTVTGKGGAIYASAGHVVVKNSIFENNVAAEGSEIYMRCYGPDTTTLNFLNISNCIINDNGESVIVSNYTNGTLLANNNWWGTNTGAEGKVSEGITVDNWVIMNVDPVLVEDASIGEAVQINVDFKHTNSTDGTIANLEGGLPEELTVNAYVTNGTLDKNTTTTEDLEAKFAFTPEFAGANVVVIYTDLTNTVPVVINVAEEYSGIIYVAKDGEDTNDGSEESPVATIAKAVELAQGKSGQIIINEGTYTENGIVITDDLNISSVGEVILNGNGLRYFDIKSGDISIANVTMTNCNNSYGGAVIRVTGGSLTIADSLIVANGGEYRDNLIRVTTASLTLNNTVFENNTAHKTSTNYGGVYVSDGVLIVDGCTFKDNFNKYGQIYVTGSSIGSYAVINNTQFIGNNATSASGGTGAAIYLGGTAAYQYTNGTVRPGAPSTVYVVDCDFINNSAKGGTYYAGQGGAIYVNNNASLYVSDSRFINNTCIDNNDGTVPSQGGAIFASAGNLFITGSVFENNIAKEGSEIYMKYYGKDNTTLNALNITNSIIKDDGESVIVSNYTNGTLLANNNWWGTNSGAEGKVTEGITVDNWVIMNVDPVLVENAHVGEAIEINVDFKHTNSTDGTIANLEGGLPEELTVIAFVTNGTLDKTTATTEDLAAKFAFTPEFTGANVVVIYTDLTNTVPVVINVAEPVQGVIYVAKDGSDENDGTEDAPVATIAKAVELAKAGLGQIIIKEGTYNENGITIDSAMSIEGQGEVIIDGTDLANASVFTVATNESVSFKNIKFANNAAPNGGAIFAERQEVDITVDNCEFDNLKATSRDGGAIGGNYLTGSLKVLNSKFTNNNARAWGGAIGIGYSAYEDGLKLEVEDCIFENNTANNGGAMYLMARNISIKDSIVNNNSATYSPGAIYMINTTAVIDNCTITNNSARDEVSAIEIHGGNIQMNPTLVNPSNVVIKNSVIEDNYGREGTAPAIQMQNSNMNASYCSIVNEFNLENTVTATYGDEKPGLVQLENIWWGSDDPESKINGTNYTVDKWVIMNLNPSATNVSAGDVVTVTVDFNHVMTADGQIEELTGGTIPKTYTVSLSAENGTLSAETLEIAQGDSVEFTFTAAGEFALITATSENDVVNITFTGDIPEPYTGIVYVSKDGDDANEGTEDEPVATIAKAIEIATAEGGSGQIVIKEGTYTENGFNITKDLTITGEGDVIIDALGDGTKLFNIGYDSGVANFELHNLALTNLASLYGAAVYSYANNMVLDNVTIAGIDSQTSRLITSNGALTVKDSVFANNTVSGLISHGGNANVTIINTTFENNNVSYDSSVFAVVYVSSGRGNITIEDSKFYGNLARQSTVRGTADTNIIVKGSEFINNTADNGMYQSHGGAIYAQANLDVTESIFINNHAKNDGGAISVGRNGEATITKSEFINNSVDTSSSEYNGAAIYNNGKTTINYSIILSNSTKYAVYNDGEESATVNAQYNWWGTNEEPQSLAGAGTWEDYWEEEGGDCQAVDVSNRIVMSVTAEGIDAAQDGSEVTLTVDFNHYIDANGEVKELEDSLAQELDVEFSSTVGTFDNEVVTTTDGVATAKYTVASGENDITVKSTNAIWNTEFATKAVPDISFEILEDSIEVSLSYEGEGLEGKTVKVSLENGTEFVATTDEDGIAVIDLSSLGPGTYEFTLSSVADEDYGAAVYEDTITYTVDPYLTELAVDDVTVIVGEGNLTAILTSNGVGVAGKTLVLDINTKLPGKAVGAIATMTAVTDEDGVAVFDLSGLEAGIYEATVSYTDGVVYESIDADVTIEVDKKAADTTVEIDDDNNLIVTVKDGEGGLEGIEVELTINNQTLKGTTDADGKAVIALGEMEDGSYPATISFTNDTYADPNLKTFVLIKTKEVEVPVEVPVVANGTMDVETDDGTVVATLTDSEGNPIANATITAIVDGEEQNFTTDENGKVSIPVGDNATVELSYTDPENGATVKYATKVVTKEVEVPVEVPVVANGTMDVETTDDAVVATLTDSEGNPIANATITAVVDGEEQNFTTDENGKVSVPIADNATVELSYTDPENGATVKYATKVVTKEVEVPEPKANATVELTTEDGSAVTVTVKDLDGKPIANATAVATVNGEETNITTDSEGKATIPLTGNSTVKVSFTDPANNATTSNEMSVTVINTEKIIEVIPNRTETVIEYSNMTTKSVVVGVDGRIGEYFYATLKDINGNPLVNKTVGIGFNGKTYNKTTDEKGQVKLQINLKAAGRYTFAIAYLGDEYYNGTFEVALITVEAQKAKLTTANKVYKASAKTKSISATFKSVSGNAIPGIKVSFTVNGKTYTAKTNSKGVATVNVSLNKKGTYSFTAKTTATNAYASVSAKAKLTIK